MIAMVTKSIQTSQTCLRTVLHNYFNILTLFGILSHNKCTNMRAVEIFSNSVQYRYKATVCSLSTLIVLLMFSIIIFVPVFVVYHAGGIYNSINLDKIFFLLIFWIFNLYYFT